MSGYDDAFYFMRVFKQVTGVSAGKLYKEPERIYCLTNSSQLCQIQSMMSR